MSDDATISWLAQLQAQFGAGLRLALDRKTGVLQAPVGDYDAKLIDQLADGPTLVAAQRFAVYHRQYWFRLFTTLQQAYPLLVDLLSAWKFNEVAAQYLAQHPPTQADLHSVVAQFALYLEQKWSEDANLEVGSDSISAAVLRCAAQIDDAFSRVIVAPDLPRFSLSPELANHLAQVKLHAAPGWRLICDPWQLLQRRHELVRGTPSVQLGEIGRTRQPVWWLVFASSTGYGVRELTSRHAVFLQLLDALPLGQALTQLEAATQADAQSNLPELVQEWLAQGVRDGLWLRDSAAIEPFAPT